MAMQELTIQRRDGTGKQIAKRLRRQGVVPAIVYGGPKTEPVTVDPKAVLRMIAGHAGTTQLLTLKMDGEGGSRLAIIRAMHSSTRRGIDRGNGGGSADSTCLRIATSVSPTNGRRPETAWYKVAPSA